MSQLKLTLTRDPRAVAIINPSRGPESKKLKSPSSGKTIKAKKGTKRLQVSSSPSCHQTLLKFLSTSTKVKVLKTLSENSVQVELKPKAFNNPENALLASEAKSKIVENISENVDMESKLRAMDDSKTSVQDEVRSEDMKNGEKRNIKFEADLKVSQTTASSSLTTLSSSQLLSTSIALPTSQTSQSTTNLPTIMSSHPVTSLQQPSSFKPVPSKISPVSSKQSSFHPNSPSPCEQPTSNPSSGISCSPPISKCSQPSTVKVSPLLAKHLQPNTGRTGFNMVSTSKDKLLEAASNREKSVTTPSKEKTAVTPSKEVQIQDVTMKTVSSNSSTTVSMATTLPLVKDISPVLPPSHRKKARRQTTVSLPISRVRTIMKTNFQSSKNGPQLGQESVPIVCKAAELFITSLVQEAEKCSNTNGQKGEINYSHLAASVNRHNKLRFLHEILPKKVLAKDCLSSSPS